MTKTLSDIAEGMRDIDFTMLTTHGPEGVDTPGLAMIRVRATRIHYWDGEDEGEVKIAGIAA